jgi:hypothetical protein
VFLRAAFVVVVVENIIELLCSVLNLLLNDPPPPPELRWLVVEDLNVTMERINDVIDVLSLFKERREPGRSRADYTDQLARGTRDPSPM